MRTRYARWRKQRLRKSRLPRWLACLVALLLNLPWTATAQTAATNATIVEVDLAKHVAAEHVNANNQPFEWRYLDHMVLHDVDGNPNGYAFIFGKGDSRFNGVTALRQHITDHTAARAKQGEDAQPSGDNDLFAFDDLATVITGATPESPLILRHFRGAPEFWIEAVKQDASRRAGTSEATQVVMVTPMDFRLVTVSAKAATPAAEPSTQTAALSLEASAEAVGVHSKKAERISALRQQAQDREARTRKRVESMTPAQKQQHEAAQQGRKDYLRTQWDTKRTDWQSAAPVGEELQ